MSQKWITDRRPTTLDSKGHRVWVMDFGAVLMTDIENVEEGQPWMPITPPEPYVKPNRWDVKEYYETGNWYVVDRASGSVRSYAVPTREAAERIAAIYEEVMP